MHNTSQDLDRRELLKQAYLKLQDMQTRLAQAEQHKNEPIAVIGMGCRFPGGAHDPASFWRLLYDGVDTVGAIPSARWHAPASRGTDLETLGEMYTRPGAFVEAVDRFDPQFFGIAPREAIKMDPQQRILLETLWETFEHAAQDLAQLRGSAVGVFIGMNQSDYADLQNQRGDVDFFDFYAGLGVARSIAAGRISYVLGLRGPNMAVDTACSSSLVAVHLACQSLRTGECRMAVAGGVMLILSPSGYIVGAKGNMLAADGRCKTFDAAADGFGRGEGCGAVLLKRLSDARADGDHIFAVILGTALNQDGKSSNLTAPSSLAQADVIRQALRNAGVQPGEVRYVEAHGTGTPLGDPIEVQALGQVYGASHSREKPLFIGSVKTNMGHAEAAAGVAGLIKTVLALHHGVIPAHLHLTQPNPHIPWDTLPIVVTTQRTPWPDEAPRRIAGVSAFGYSGTNAHVIVASAPPVDTLPAHVERPWHVLSLSAQSAPALQQLRERYLHYMERHPGAPLGDLCFAANTGRSHYRHRLAVAGATLNDMSDALRAWRDRPDTPATFSGIVASEQSPRLAFLFTGQGAQAVGMGRLLYDTQPTFRATLEQCNELLRPYLDTSLLSIVYPQPGEDRQAQHLLHQTAFTQPALFAIEYALATLWQSWGITPTAVMGHSVGEYVAACVAGVFSLEDGVKLIAERGRLMQALPAGGAMATVFADAAQVAEVIAPYAQVSIAALNSSENTVISGPESALQAVLRTFQEAGIASQRLTVSHAFHSALMEPMLPDFDRCARSIRYHEPRIDMVSNVLGRVVEPHEVTSSAYWRRHVRAPVRFAASMQTLHQQGYRFFLEVGPHPTLLGMAGQCLPATDVVLLPSLRRGMPDWQPLLASLGTLYARGVAVDWQGFDRDYPRRRLPLPTYPFQRERYWLEPKARTLPAPTRWPGHNGQQAHPILCRYLHGAHPPGSHMWEGDLDLRTFTYLADHQVQGAVVVPATLALEMVVAAATQLFGEGPVILSQTAYKRPLVLTESTRIALQLVCTRASDHHMSFYIYSRAHHDSAPASAAGDWTLYATGTVEQRQAREIPQTLVPERLADIRTRCTEAMSGQDFYQRLRHMGNDYGPCHQGIEQLWRGEDEVFARVGVPPMIAAESADYHLHPALADAWGQVLSAVIDCAGSTDESHGAFVVSGVEQVRFFRRPHGASMWVHGRVQRQDEPHANVFKGDIRVMEDSGELVAELLGVRYRYLGYTTALTLSPPHNDWLYALQWVPRARFQDREMGQAAMTRGEGGWLIFHDQGGLGEAFSALADAAGRPWVLVAMADARIQRDARHFAIRPDHPDDFQWLLETIAREHTAPWHGILHLWSLDAVAPQALTVEALARAQVMGCASVMHLVQALARSTAPPWPRVWLMTQRAMPVDAASDPVALAQAPLWGVGRALALEYPDLWGGLIDLDAIGPQEAAPLLWRELEQPDGEDQLVFRAGQRLAARLVRAELPSEALAPFHCQPESSYLITGGLGGLGLEVAHWLVEKGARYLVLLGRTPMPPRAQWEALPPKSRMASQIARVRELEARGARVYLAAVDVADTGQMQTFWETWQRTGWPALRGVVHAAGTPQYESLLEHDLTKMMNVMRAKVIGGWLLDRLLGDTPLDFFVLFSSISALLSTPRMASYAAANVFLDALAAYRTRHGHSTLSINWGLWSEVGMAAYVQIASPSTLRPGAVALKGIEGIPSAEGLAMLERLLQQDVCQMGVIPIDWAQLHSTYPILTQLPLLADLARAEGQRAPTQEPPDLTVLHAAVPSARFSLIRAYLSAHLARILGLAHAALDVQQPLANLGFDSLMALEMKNRLETDLGVVIPVVQFLQGPSIVQLATLVLQALDTPSVTAPDSYAPDGEAVAASPGTEHDDDWTQGVL